MSTATDPSSGVSPGPSARPLEITSSRMEHLWDGLSSAYDLLGFARAVRGDEVFGSWCWRGSSSPPAKPTACGCWPRSASTLCPPTPRSTVACRPGRRLGLGQDQPVGHRLASSFAPAPFAPGLAPADVDVLHRLRSLAGASACLGARQRVAGVAGWWAGWNSSIRLPPGSAIRIWRPPGPETNSLRKGSPALRSRAISASQIVDDEVDAVTACSGGIHGGGAGAGAGWSGQQQPQRSRTTSAKAGAALVCSVKPRWVV
jgi:hypothetical protein